MKTLWVFLLCFLPLSAGIESRVKAHIGLKDPSTAFKEATWAVERYGSDPQVAKAYFLAAASVGDEAGMQKGFELVKQHKNEDTLECLELYAYAILEKAHQSSSPLVRFYAALSAHFARSREGVLLLARSLRDPHIVVQAISMQLASREPHMILKKEVSKLLHQKKNWPVYLEAITAAGLMKIEWEKETLSSILLDEKSSKEEKARAAQALFRFFETVSDRELLELSGSERSELRGLAVDIAFERRKESDLKLILKFKDDPSNVLRATVPLTIGQLRLSSIDGCDCVSILKEMMYDRDWVVAITSTWALLFYEPLVAQERFKEFLLDSRVAVREAAAIAIAHGGKHAMPLLRQEAVRRRNGYGRWNLLLAAARLGVIDPSKLEAVANHLLTSGDLMVKERMPPFGGLQDSLLKGPLKEEEMRDRITRLEVLLELSILGYEGALEAVKTFLKKAEWGISGIAAQVLLMESTLPHMEILQELLGSDDLSIRSQAAILLATLGKKKEALSTLIEVYPKADRELKERILEAVGSLSETSALPFLEEKLKESSLTLRVIAASAIIQTIYH